MALKTFNPNPKPSPGTSFAPQVKVLEAEFGDGYSQPTPDGINNIRETVDLAWDGLTEREMQVLYKFFMDRKGSEPFYYTPAGYSSAMKWTCKEWGKKISEGVWKMNAKLIQSFTAET